MPDWKVEDAEKEVERIILTEKLPDKEALLEILRVYHKEHKRLIKVAQVCRVP